MQTVANLYNLSDEQIEFIVDLWNRDCPADIICDHFEEEGLGPEEIETVIQKHFYKN
jgi:hypothetical protein